MTSKRHRQFNQPIKQYKLLYANFSAWRCAEHNFECGIMGDSHSPRYASAPSLFLYLVFVMIYLENPGSNRLESAAVFWQHTSGSQDNLQLSWIKNLEEEIAGNFCSKTEITRSTGICGLFKCNDCEDFYLDGRNKRNSRPIIVNIVWWKIFLKWFS